MIFLYLLAAFVCVIVVTTLAQEVMFHRRMKWLDREYDRLIAEITAERKQEREIWKLIEQGYEIDIVTGEKL